MGISGYEALVMSTISPIFLAIKPLRTFFTRNQRIAHLIPLAGLAAYLVKSPVARLLTVGFGVWMQCLAWSAGLYADSVHPSRLEGRILALAIGLIMSSAAKFAWQTNNPLWPIMNSSNGGYNGIGLAIAVLASLRFTRKAPAQSGGEPKKGSALLSALGIGGVFFGLHSLLSDTSTMILWVWDGFPVRGPVFNVHAYYTIAAMTGGILLALYRPGLVTSWTAYGVACVGAAVVTLYHQWVGYYGALTLALYLPAIAIPLITNAAKKSPAVTFGLGFFIYNLMVLFHVWVVAYAFVPGGPLVREHTDWVMTSMMVLIGAGVFDLAAANAKAGRKAAEQRRRVSAAGHRKYFAGALGVLNVFFLATTFLRFPTNDYKPYHPEDRLLTAGIWTIHFGLDNDMWSSEYRMRDLIKELEIDVVGLLESDQQRIIMGNRDTTQFLAEELGMYVDYGPGPNKHTWGAALLSKFPIVNSTHHLLPSPVGELAPSIHATLDVYGTLVDVHVFHSGQEEDPEDRRLQTEYLSKLMGSSSRPSILLSYLVTRPLEGTTTHTSRTSAACTMWTPATGTDGASTFSSRVFDARVTPASAGARSPTRSFRSPSSWFLLPRRSGRRYGM